jgi:molybdopterin converting factor small subunit
VPNLLKQLELEELSLVDRPANAQATVSLYKRDNSNGEPMEHEVEKMSDDLKAKLKPYMDKGMSEEEAMKMYNMDMKKADDATIEELEIETLKALEVTLKEENERLRKSLIDNGFIIKAESIEKKVDPEYVEYDGEQINKADIPAPILKALEAAEIEKADAALAEKAKEALPNFNLDVAKSLTKAFSEDEAIMEALKGADAVFAESMEEVGKSDADGEFATANDKLDALVKSYMDENKMKKSHYAVAYAAVAKTDEGKALINKSYKGE